MKLFGVENLLIECIGTDSVKLGIQRSGSSVPILERSSVRGVPVPIWEHQGN